MSAVLSPEQEQIKETARQFLEREMPLDLTVSRVDCRQDWSAVWGRLASELGAQALYLPEKAGGIGGSFMDLAMVLEESGRTLSPLPMHMTAAAGALLRHHGSDPIVMQHLKGIAEGATVMAIDVSTAAGASSALVADPAGRSGTVRGTTGPIVGAGGATHLLTWIEDMGATIVDLSEATTVKTFEPADPTRTLVAFQFHGAMVTGVGTADTQASSRHALDVVRVALALDSVGGARRCLELAVEYAKTREQFGKPIGSFQAIKHKCADMLLAVESATSTAYVAAAAVDGDDPDALSVAAGLAYGYATAAYAATAAETIQILGGIGFTWEHSAHLYFKRSKVNSVIAGSALEVRLETAARLGMMNQHIS